MIATTISSSIRVKPFWFFIRSPLASQLLVQSGADADPHR
jgi:hypothetical protein